MRRFHTSDGGVACSKRRHRAIATRNGGRCTAITVAAVAALRSATRRPVLRWRLGTTSRRSVTAGAAAARGAARRQQQQQQLRAVDPAAAAGGPDPHAASEQLLVAPTATLWSPAVWRRRCCAVAEASRAPPPRWRGRWSSSRTCRGAACVRTSAAPTPRCERRCCSGGGRTHRSSSRRSSAPAMASTRGGRRSGWSPTAFPSTWPSARAVPRMAAAGD